VIKVLIADDHPLVRGALVDVLTGTGDRHVVAECADGSEVAEAAARTRPDVVLMDLMMPRMSGLDAARALLAAQADARVVMLTGSLTPASAREARALGVHGFLLKGDDPAEVVEHLRSVAAGATAWHAAAAAVAEPLPPPAPPQPDPAPRREGRLHYLPRYSRR